MIKISGMPVLVHPQVSKIATELTDLLHRFNLYGEEINKQTKQSGMKLIVLLGLKHSDYENLNLEHFPYLDVIRISNSTSNFIFFGIKSMLKLSKSGISATILISGDLASGLLSSFFISRFSRRRIPIQASIHGSLTTPQKVCLKSFLKLMLLKIILPRVNSFRVVSNFLKDELVSIFNIDTGLIFVAPVPINRYPTHSIRNSMQLNIGIVGRLHYERNLYEAMQIVDSVIPSGKIGRVLILGDGPMRPVLDKWVSNHYYKNKFLVVGAVPQTIMLKYWNQIDILLSCAKSEGYGLALREAIISGAIAIARENLGTLELQDQFPENVLLYRSPLEVAKLLDIATLLFKDLEIEKVSKKQKLLDSESVSRVARSWTRI